MATEKKNNELLLMIVACAVFALVVVGIIVGI
jgi:hypothetical protein